MVLKGFAAVFRVTLLNTNAWLQDMTKIPSETQLFLRQLKFLVTLPYLLFSIWRKQRPWQDLLNPWKDFWSYALAPRATVALIFVNVVAFIVSMFIPVDGLINQSVDIFSSRIYTLVTTSFFHADLGHLAANMLGLWVFGRVVERRIGRMKMLGVYFGATIIAVATSSLVHLLIFQENIAGLGASGGLMGLVATAILLEPFYLTYDFGIPLPIMVYGWIALAADVLGVIHPLDSGIGHFAHLGGFLSVAILGYFLSHEEQHKLRVGLFINLISLALAGAIYLLMR